MGVLFWVLPPAKPLAAAGLGTGAIAGIVAGRVIVLLGENKKGHPLIFRWIEVGVLFWVLPPAKPLAAAGLGTGAIAGIVAGRVIVLLGAGYCYYRHRSTGGQGQERGADPS